MTTATTPNTLPDTGTWIFDPAHTTIEFVARHLVVSRVRGRFTSFSGRVEVADPVEQSTVEVTIDAGSITTNDDQRDGHLSSGDFLDVATFPTLVFRSTGLRPLGDDRWVLAGELTIRAVTRPVELEVAYLGVVTDPWGRPHAGFAATTEIERDAFGITWNQALEAGGVMVGNTVGIEIEAQLVPAV